MTLTELVRTLWVGRWFVAAAVFLGLCAGGAYLATREVPFHSVATVQFRIDTPAAATVSPPVVTIDPVDVTSAKVAERAAEILGDGSQPLDLTASVDASHDPVTARVTIGAQALSDERSADVANAFADAYVEYVDARWEAELTTLEANMESTRTRALDLQAEMLASPADPIVAADLDAVLSSYGALAAQQNIAAGLGSPAALAQAAGGGTPIGMGAASVLLLALLAGVFLGCGLALLRRALDSTISTAKLARATAGAPVLAELADVRRSAQTAALAGLLPVDGRSATPFTESIRELRTSIQAAKEGAALTIVVSATEPDAPRSFIVANLAASWALSGRDTIVMSGDLRRSDLEDLLPAPDGWEPTRTPGWGQGDLEPVHLHREDGPVLGTLRPTAVNGLRYLPAPTTSLDPADYLASAAARRMIDQVRAAGQVVIIDAPPVLAAADAIILGGYTDGVVLVATVGHTDRSVLEDAASRLAGANVTLIGVALHGRTADKRMTYTSTYAPEQPDAVASETVPDVPVPSDAVPDLAVPDLAVPSDAVPDVIVPARPPRRLDRGRHGGQVREAEPAARSGSRAAG
ncbi:tyrosine-protein kinase domain-containing protein [Sanguibacter antarcticus]|uniref:Mrp family chromosome partitioning ATPase n=1 Tax=Sanguibacter antarcticus TaxID=372484 RepID=A0A2A9E0G6_9MICO|nr:CpsD/CapB family tyrosine-protein kinase [Sanguibacter antarcticus]PFG32333.1 Mrp family chromosome partitioning ATPase [Sanguibacter antarcticus]